MKTEIKLRVNVFIDQQPVMAGSVVAVDENLARYMATVGRAEYVVTEPPAPPEPPVVMETAAVEPVSKAVMPKAKKR